ncbi:Uncharacterised protein [Vibrio cholerae]|nr:Uncharacterised protein [Vibrio cholerae]CSI82814.1 Uncharacterised protein [Vibrio cholerae]
MLVSKAVLAAGNQDEVCFSNTLHLALFWRRIAARWTEYHEHFAPPELYRVLRFLVVQQE